ncbi:hypothetical protein N665_0116s0076 [Sinapis alba]|nr:hypothetical protein N665_0116s0076 [Sinapis alba]
MAFSTRSSIFFFTTLVLFSTQINARDSYFFGKFHRESPKDQNPNNVLPLETSEKTTVEESFPNKKEQEVLDPTFLPESENGYGLYGHETTYNDNKDEFNNNKYDEKVNGETFSTPSLSETEESYNNYDEKYPKKTESYDNNEEFNNNNNKYDENVKEESYSENNEDKRSFYNSNAYGTELERETPYKGYSHKMERQGMSDTRFMEKGNYYQSYSYGNNNYNSEEEKSFKDPYNSKWEKNMMNEQPEGFVEEQGDQFKP